MTLNSTQEGLQRKKSQTKERQSQDEVIPVLN